MTFARVPVLRSLTTDGRLLFGTRCARLFAYGLLSVFLVSYLKSAGLGAGQTGLLLALTLVGDVVISLWITTKADRAGRRKMLIIGSLLMIFAGATFALTSNFWLLLLAATVGVISPSGNEVGPFLSIEQAALSQTVAGDERTHVFAWYNLVGSVATAVGALCGGGITQFVEDMGATGVDKYRPLAIAYAAIGGLLALAFTCLSPAAEVAPRDSTALHTATTVSPWGLGPSLPMVVKLASLFALDALGGGFIMQSIMADWLHARFAVEPATIGAIFFGANLLAAASALAAAAVARRIGLVNTMVFTHVPSNVLLILVPFMPTLGLAILVLLLRFSISQMDVPTRQSLTMAVVRPEERSAAAGVTGVARSLGAAISPGIAVVLVASAPLMSAPFFLAGGIKLVYDLLLYRSVVTVPPAEEKV